MKQPMVMGNWKMNGSRLQIATLLDSLLAAELRHCAVFPPAIYLPMVQAQLEGSGVSWGAQNVYPKDSGAYTGELSAPMLHDFNCQYVLVGHSERRHLLGEDENFVAKKFHHVKDHDMIPVLCIGETLAEREQGLTEAVIQSQLMAVTHGHANVFNRCVIAYEPVWAIGTGKTATADEAQKVHGYIRRLMAEFEKENAAAVSILYGGSVNEHNARALFSMPDVDGGLVGGASLNAQQFVEIVKCIN